MTGSENPDIHKRDFLTELVAVAQRLGHLPTAGEIDEHAEFSHERYRKEFGDLFNAYQEAGIIPDSATRADFSKLLEAGDDDSDTESGSEKTTSSVDQPSEAELLEELRRLNESLDRLPYSADMDKEGAFTAHTYQDHFGSWDEALSAAGIDKEAELLRELQEIADQSDGVPLLSDLEERGKYSAGMYVRFFGSWTEAKERLEEWGPGQSEELTGESVSEENETSGQAETVGQPGSDSGIVRNELSERYETLHNLREICQTIVDARRERIAGETETDRPDPMDQWAKAIDSHWSGESVDADSYEDQQSARNPFNMQEYREAFGDGDRVTDFEQIDARPPSVTMQVLLEPLLSSDPAEYYLPVDTKTDTRLPIIVESEGELDSAVEMLQRLPSEPAAASVKKQTESSGQEIEYRDSERKAQSAELTEINGITEAIADTLRDAGYNSRGDLRKASIDDLANIDSVSEQIAMRIKLDVGG